MKALFADTMDTEVRGYRRIRLLAAGLIWAAGVVLAAQGQSTQPLVAIHDSELTRALESMPASGATPTGSGTTGYQWWPTDWHYFVMPESVKEALLSDGTAFTAVGDANITAGLLLTNGLPRYPILISLACEAIRDDEIAPLTNYVAAGGFLLVGSSAFTRTTNGTARGDFAFANALGVHVVRSGLTNWAANSTFTLQNSHRLVGDIPAGQLTWRMPSYSEEIPWGISPSHPYMAPHDVWQVRATDATVLAQGDSYPYLLVKPFGKGYFIYNAAFQPLVGHGGFAPGMYAYIVFRRAIEWAFAAANLPVPKLSPWPYQYDAAFMIRHDLENFTNEIAAISASAKVEYTNGAKGDYYFCTGTVRDDTSGTTKNNIIAGLRSAVTNYGATIGPHNGGLKNPNNSSLVRGQYDYWHWGPDEALDVTPSGYASGKVYAFTSISNSFRDVEGWLSGITNGLRAWVGCYFNATREDSYDIQAGLNIKIAGDQKLTPFPHWTLSTRTPGKRYGFLTEPVSDWYVGGLVAQSLEPWHPPGVYNSAALHSAVDFYYNLGALINIYSHTLSTGLGDAGALVADYITYSLNTNAHPRIWSANAVGVYQWWLQRSNAQISVSYATNGNQSLITISVSRAANTNTAIELLIPGTNSFCALSVLANGLPANTNSYRVNGQVIKLRVGTTVTNAVVGYYSLGPSTQISSENFDGVTAPALPSGWSTSASGAQSSWVTQKNTYDTGPNAAFSTDAANVGVNELVSSPIALPAGTGQLSFRNNYDLETGSGGDGYDGGVLEIKIGTNSFTDILAAGGSFVSGGYNSTIDTAYANPLAGRSAWSGSSGGFITTVVNLPAAAGGQTIQLKWRCGTDNGVGKNGWRIDTVTLGSRGCSCCGGGISNTPPVLPTQANRTIVALATLTVTNTASDTDLPTQTLSYQLVAPPTGAGINANGVITWTPTSAQAPSTNLITTVVTDNGTPPFSATNSFTTVVIPANSAPVLPAQANQTIAELTALTVINTATDPDRPAQTLSYQLIAPPAGASIDGSGTITWTPTEAQGPGTYTLTTVVTDNGTPPLSATNSFRVTVTEVNTAPALPAQANRTIAELTTLVVTNTATDTDIPANTLAFALLAAPAGAAISPAGVITWTPSEAQGPSTNLITTVVTDNGVPPLSATNVFTVFVTATNTAPVLAAQANRTIAELTTLMVTNTATDGDVPANTLTYILAGAPAGAAISTSGVITWTPSEFQGPGTYTLTTVVTDNGIPPLSATNSFTVTVTEVNNAPVLSTMTNRTIVAQTTLLVTNTATEADMPANVLAYSLVNPPTGAAIDTNGIIAWTPTMAQAPSTNVIKTVVTDNGSPPLSATNVFSVFVTATNTAPVLPAQANRTLAELTTLMVTNTATDADIPANTLTYILVGAPAGVAISTSGVITWTPSEVQGPGAYTLTTVVTDNGVPPLRATNSFTATVTEANSAPVLPTQTNRTITAQSTLSVTNTATDSDIPANVLTYSLLNPPTGAVIGTNGVIAWTPTAGQAPSTNLVRTVVTDNGTPPLSATNSFTVVVNAGSMSNRLFFENFDGVTAPALPSGWTTSATGAESPWVTRSTANDTAPNAAYAPDPANIGTCDLVSPSIALPAGQSRLSFRNNYNLEADRSGYYDGGVLEIKVGAGSFTDILAAGGSFVSGGYNGTISTAYSSPIAGRQAWSSNSVGFVTTTVNLPAAAAGQTIQLRWRCATDDGNGNNITNGWYVDTVAITNAAVSGSPVVLLDSATLIAESFSPANNAVDPGETVTLLFGLRDAGNANTTNLVATLLPTNGVVAPSAPQTYGVLVTGGAAVSQAFTFTASGACGGTITPTLRLQDGTANLGTVAVALTLGQNSTLFTQSFDTVTVPALPSDWTNAVTGVGAPWITRTSTNATPPNVAYVTDPANVGTSELVSPAITLSLGPSQLTFRNNYSLEADSSGYYDGGVLEIKIGANSFTDILAAGGSFVSGGYNGTISTAYSNPIAGRQAWSSNSVGFVTTTVNLPTAAAGQTIQLRWRCATDVGNGNNLTNGWYIDSIGISGRVCADTSGAQAMGNFRQLVVSAPVIQSIVLAGDSVVINWSTVSGKSYRLQFTDALENAKWNDALTDVLATGLTATATNAIGSSPQRFYRVLLVP
jgi:hypothetical protein